MLMESLFFFFLNEITPQDMLLKCSRMYRVCGQLQFFAVKWKSHPVSLREKLTHSESFEHSVTHRDGCRERGKKINEKFFAPTLERAI